ncbi:MAG: MFS transporter [Zavarzinella sp.]
MSVGTPTSRGLMFKLSLMMFLQFFIWGAWFETGFSYIPGMKFAESWMTTLVFGAFNVGALVALFFSTQLADRKFAAEKFLAVSHLIGGLAIGGLFFLQTPLGTEVGTFNSAQIVSKATPTSAIAKMTDGTQVLVENVTTEASSNKYWEGVDKLEAEKKPTVTFTITAKEGDQLVGDFSKPLAPFWLFLGLMLLHAVVYVPTISITNSIAFTAFTNPEKQFGPVRLWGTIGWIAASWPFIFILVDWALVNKNMAGGGGFTKWLGVVFESSLSGAGALDGKRYVFLVAGLASLLLAAYSLLLPHTPPKPASGQDSLAWLKAMRLLKHPFVLVLFLVTFIDAAVHQSYFFWTFDFLAGPVGIPTNWAGAVMKIGQLAEILTMLVLGYVLKNLGWRITLTIGVLGHAARFAVFAFYPGQTPVILVIALHGVCYAFFFATVYIFVDTYFPKDIRSSAQGLFNVLILGVGPFVANYFCGVLNDKYPVSNPENYKIVFQYSMFAALIGAVMLLVLFHPKKLFNGSSES